MKNKKAGMSISIVLLVLATLVLSGYALFTFYTREKSVQEKVYVPRIIEDVYSKEEQINFYLDQIVENAALKTVVFEGESAERIFADSLKKELEESKDKNGNFPIIELNQIEEQVKEENVEFDEEKGTIAIEFEIKIENNAEIKGKEIFSTSYTYRKKFEKTLKGL